MTDSRLPARLRAYRPSVAGWSPLGWTIVAVVALGLTIWETGTLDRPFGFSFTAALTSGLSDGALYALVALGVALVYRATRVINFAQGALGTTPAYLALVLLLGAQSQVGSDVGLLDQEVLSEEMVGWQFALIILAAIALGAVLAVAVNLLIIRRLANASPATTLVATTGVALALIQLQLVVFKAKNRRFPRLVEGAPGGFEVGPFCFSNVDDGQCVTDGGNLAFGGQVVLWNTILIFALLVAVSIALAVFFRSQPGVALLATAQEPFAAELYGVSSKVMSSLAWGIAGGFAALAGVLAAGATQQLRPGYMTGAFLIPALVGAVLGGLTSMVGAVVGSLIVGVVAALATSTVVQLGLTTDIPGAPILAVFAALVLVLILRPRGLLGKDA